MINKLSLKTFLFIFSLSFSLPLFARSDDAGSAIGVAVIGIIFISILFWVINQVKSKAYDYKASQKLSSSNNAVELFQTGVHYFNNQSYKKSLEFSNKSLSVNPNYVDAKKLQLSSLEHLDDYFGYEKESAQLLTKTSSGEHKFVDNSRDNYTAKEQASVFFNISKAKKLNGNLTEGKELRELAINLDPVFKSIEW